MTSGSTTGECEGVVDSFSATSELDWGMGFISPRSSGEESTALVSRGSFRSSGSAILRTMERPPAMTYRELCIIPHKYRWVGYMWIVMTFMFLFVGLTH